MNNLMRRSGIIAVLCMLLCLCLLVCSCGGKGGNDETTPAETTAPVSPEDTTPEDTTPEDTTPEDTTPEDTTPEVETVTYTVTVKNEAGVGIAGVGVQLCAEQCHPAVTNASGVATFTLPEAVYQAGITGAVSGYVVDTSAKYDFAAGATSLEIVLKAAAPAPTEGAINLKTDKDVVTEHYPVHGEMLYFHGYIVGDVDAEELEDAAVEVKAGDSVVYTYEATADGAIELYVFKALGTKVSVKNITTGATYQSLSGEGLIELPVTAGNTYEITVDYTLTEKVLYVVAAGAYPDGSKDAPYYLTAGVVAMNVVIPEGETVWFYYDDSYLLIENPYVKVNIDGVLYAPDAEGKIDAELLGIADAYDRTLIGISSTEADAKVQIELSGSDADHPVSIYDWETYADGSFTYFATEDVKYCVDYIYCYVPVMGAVNTDITVTIPSGKVTVDQLETFSYETFTYVTVDAVDTNVADNVAAVNVAGYTYFYFAVTSDAGSIKVDYTFIPGCDEAPFEVEFEENATSTTATITKEQAETLDGQVFYTYTATEDCVLTVIVPAVEDVNPWDNNFADCPYGITVPGEEYPSYNYVYDENDNPVINLSKGDSVVIVVGYGAAQAALNEGAGADLVVTFTVA